MSRKELIQKTIDLINNTIKSYNIWSIVLFACALISILIAYRINVGKETSDKMLQWGFSTITTLSAGVFQGFNYQKRTSLLNLEFTLSRVDQYEDLPTFDKAIVDNVLKNLIK